MRLPIPCLVVLVGPANTGKTTWAMDNFSEPQIVSSDALRAQVGESEDDQRASQDAFEVLDSILARRLRRRLTTVVDTTGLQAERRQGYLELARQHGLPSYLVPFDVAAKDIRARNKARARPVPARVLSSQIKAFEESRDELAEEGFDAVLEPSPVVLVPPDLVQAPVLADQQLKEPVPLRFELDIPNFTWPGGPEELGDRLATIVTVAEQVGFDGIWVMDHFIQIPRVGREWDEMLEGYTTLGFIAGNTRVARLGVLVTGITYRNPALVGKMVATLDVLSGGRAACGLGAAWFQREHEIYGWDFPADRERLDLLEDALQLLPLMWGPGSPSFEGKMITVPEAIGYPRPLQEHVPIIVGGQGERRTLRLAAQYADGCNLFGDPNKVRHKLAVLEKHCADVGRDPAEIEVTHLSRAVVAADQAGLDDKVDALVAPGRAKEKALASLGAGTVEDQIGRYRALADAGVQTAIVNFPDAGEPAPLEEFAPVIAAFE